MKGKIFSNLCRKGKEKIIINRPSIFEKMLSSKTPFLRSTLKTFCVHRSAFCKHEGSCLRHCLNTFLRGLVSGYAIRTSLNTLFVLLSMRKSMKSPMNIAFRIFLCGGDVRLPAFISLMNGFRSIVQCLMRYYRGKEDGVNAFVSGFIGAFIGMMVENKKNYYTWRMFLGGRAIETLLNGLVNRGYIKKKGWFDTVSFAVSSSLIAKGYFYDPKIIENDVFKLYTSFAKLGIPEKTWHLS